MSHWRIFGSIARALGLTLTNLYFVASFTRCFGECKGRYEDIPVDSIGSEVLKDDLVSYCTTRQVI